MELKKLKFNNGRKMNQFFPWASSWLLHRPEKMEYLAELKVTDTVSVTQYGVTSFFFRNPTIKVLTLVIFNINTPFSCIIAKNNLIIIHYYMKTINLSNMLHNPHIVCSTSGILFAFEEPLRHSSMMASRIVKCFGTLNVH